LLLVFLLCFLPGISVGAEGKKGIDGTTPPSPDRIHITSDRLVSETKSKTAEFIGNVRATQENTVITSDRLKIYYKESKDSNSNDTAGGQSIDRIIASGNVTILMDDKMAESDQAVYISKTDVLILTGRNSKITSEKNSVSGDKITLYRKDDRMEVDSSSQERVEVILYTKDKGLR